MEIERLREAKKSSGSSSDARVTSPPRRHTPVRERLGPMGAVAAAQQGAPPQTLVQVQIRGQMEGTSSTCNGGDHSTQISKEPSNHSKSISVVSVNQTAPLVPPPQAPPVPLSPTPKDKTALPTAAHPLMTQSHVTSNPSAQPLFLTYQRKAPLPATYKLALGPLNCAPGPVAKSSLPGPSILGPYHSTSSQPIKEPQAGRPPLTTSSNAPSIQAHKVTIKSLLPRKSPAKKSSAPPPFRTSSQTRTTQVLDTSKSAAALRDLSKRGAASSSGTKNLTAGLTRATTQPQPPPRHANVQGKGKGKINEKNLRRGTRNRRKTPTPPGMVPTSIVK